MPAFWFCMAAILLSGYVILDGFDLGAGIIHHFVAKNSNERRTVLASIGPVWDGNEVWLLGAGGTLFFAFPTLYASSFSGFYLALTIVLWLLILRGIAIEFRSHVKNELWFAFWDVVFSGASSLLAIFFGTALGNVVRGVPIDADGFFFLPLWTNFRPGSDVGIIDWYSLLVGVTSLVTLAVHGALWVALKTEGAVQSRSETLVKRLWIVLTTLTLLVSVASFFVQPLLSTSFAERPWIAVFPLISAIGLAGMRFFLAHHARAFLSSCAFILGLLFSAAAGLYPNLLPSNTDPSRSLTIANASATAYGLEIGLIWFAPAFVLVIAYTVFVYRHFAGKVDLQAHGH